METNNNGNKGVFPGTPIPSQGTIQTGPPIPEAPKRTAMPANLSHHENSDNEAYVEAPTQAPADTTTFISLQTSNDEGQVSGIIEVDLISFRERGQESRFLSINTTGSDSEGNQSSTSININNEADFNRFKHFISNLNWND